MEWVFLIMLYTLYLRYSVYYQDQVVKRVMLSIQHITEPQGHQLTRRPFQAAWYSNQLALCVYLICLTDAMKMNAPQMSHALE